MIEWNVYYENFNGRKIEKYNIFNHYSFMRDCTNAAKINDDNKVYFAEAVKRSLMYFFWSKCEWEIILSEWPPGNRCEQKKISVYDQVMLNWDAFIDYIWNNRKELIKDFEKGGD